MNKNLVRIIAICIAALLVLGLLGPLAYTFVFANPDDKSLDEIHQEMNITLADISKIETELNEAEEKVRQLNETIEESAKGLEEIDKKTQKAQEPMKQYKNESRERFRVMC